jgi:hypothetical protein
MADNDEQKPKGKSFKSIADILNVDDSNSFDSDEAEKEVQKLEERKKQIEEFKKKFEEIQACTNTDEYMGKVLKELVSKGMVMLDSLQREIEDCPRGRDVETAAAMMSSINLVIDNINKIKVSNAKMGFEQQKIDMKKNALTGPQVSANANILMVGTTNDLMEFLMKKEVIPDNCKVKTIDVVAEKVENPETKTKDDKSENS